MTTHTFSTDKPVKLTVELGKGNIEVTATDTDTTTIEIEGPEPDRFRVEQSGDRITVIDPKLKKAISWTGQGHDIVVTVPAQSQLRTRTGSADVHVDGELRAAWCDTGSGDIELDRVSDRVEVNTGSGDVHAHQIDGETSIKTGSGDVELYEALGATGPVRINTASGDISLGRATAVIAKTASGALEIGSAEGDVRLSTASGDLQIKEFSSGSVTVKGASGDVRIGIPDGTPVWTDVNTVTGHLSSSLSSVGEPEPGQPYVELRVTTVSGDVALIGL